MNIDDIFSNKKNEDPFNRKHGSLYDRGSADAYYRRKADPHWYPEGTGRGERLKAKNEKEVTEYMLGFNSQDTFKEY